MRLRAEGQVAQRVHQVRFILASPLRAAMLKYSYVSRGAGSVVERLTLALE